MSVSAGMDLAGYEDNEADQQQMCSASTMRNRAKKQGGRLDDDPPDLVRAASFRI